MLPQLVVVKFRNLGREMALERCVLARSGKEVTGSRMDYPLTVGGISARRWGIDFPQNDAEN